MKSCSVLQMWKPDKLNEFLKVTEGVDSNFQQNPADWHLNDRLTVHLHLASLKGGLRFPIKRSQFHCTLHCWKQGRRYGTTALKGEHSCFIIRINAHVSTELPGCCWANSLCATTRANRSRTMNGLVTLEEWKRRKEILNSEFQMQVIYIS